MDENHQGKTGNKLKATEDTLWLPPLSPKGQAKVKQLQRKPFAERMGFAGKTPWDWLQLLIIPVVLAVGGFLFTAYQHDADQQRALDQQRATILQTYIDNIQDLLLHENLRASKPDDPVAILARARTLTALGGLDPKRKAALLQFLYEASLISVKKTIIDLSDADLTNADLLFAHLDDANLSGANLVYANLGYAYLSRANLSRAFLDDANLSGADLDYANLSEAFLHDAHLSGDVVRTNLSHADLSGADLNGAKLNHADLGGAKLSHAFLSDADLNGVKLGGAELIDALQLTQQQLDQVDTCKGATLPKGLTCHHNR